MLPGSTARAEVARFEFSEFFATGSVGSITITGSFSGALQDGRITGLTDIHLYRDGNPFRGNGALFTAQFDKETRQWGQGGYLSLDGSDNNIMFIDTDFASGDAGFFNYFYSVSGIGNSAFQPSFYRYRVPETNRMTVTLEKPAVVGVPEPSAWALLIVGFGAVGASLRRRRAGLLPPIAV